MDLNYSKIFQYNIFLVINVLFSKNYYHEMSLFQIISLLKKLYSQLSSAFLSKVNSSGNLQLSNIAIIYTRIPRQRRSVDKTHTNINKHNNLCVVIIYVMAFITTSKFAYIIIITLIASNL